MITITIPGAEQWDPLHNEFVITKDTTVTLEHSLISISKWEAKTHKPFLSKNEKTIDEILFYIQCMCLTPNVDPIVFNGLTQQNIEAITSYIDDPMTATTINDPKAAGRAKKEILTSEVIYYQMVALGIPFECQKWHINRLLTLIKVCDIKNSPGDKMGRKELAASNTALNAARRAKLGTKG